MGFSSAGVKKLQIKNMIKKVNKSGSEQYKVSSPNVLKLAKEHFGCDSLDGLLMENYNLHHWEHIQFGSEIQLAQKKFNSKISQITLAFFEDLGWYKVNYSFGQKIPFGLKKGCDFINHPKPEKFKEFALNNNNSYCSGDFLSTGFFRSDKFSSGLKVQHNTGFCAKNIKNLNYSCLEILNRSNNITNRCKKSECYMKDGKVAVKFSHYDYKNAFNFFCTEDDKVINNTYTRRGRKYTGNLRIKCPNIKKFCEYKYDCKNNCNARGLCINGECLCDKKFKGFACEFENKTKEEAFVKNKKCNFNGYHDGNKCVCYKNYKGDKCEGIIVDLGSFGSNCKNSTYSKCYTGDFYKYLNPDYVKPKQEEEEKSSKEEEEENSSGEEEEKSSEEEEEKNSKENLTFENIISRSVTQLETVISSLRKFNEK